MLKHQNAQSFLNELKRMLHCYLLLAIFFWGDINLEALVLCSWFHDFLVNWSPKLAKITSAKFHRSWMRLSEKIKI